MVFVVTYHHYFQPDFHLLLFLFKILSHYYDDLQVFFYRHLSVVAWLEDYMYSFSPVSKQF
jgi:hypothetical protein